MLKYGKIEQIDKVNAKVRFDDIGTISGWLQICQRGSYKLKTQEVPEIGTKVACLMDENLEDGCVIGAIYTDEETLPDNDTTKIMVEYSPNFTCTIERLKGILTALFEKISVGTKTFELNAGALKINGVELIKYLNNHKHTNDNQGDLTGAPTEAIPNE